MIRQGDAIDISAMPELARLAEEVARTGTARVLRRDEEDIAVLVPARLPRRRKADTATPEEREASLSSTFGAWSGLVDGEQLKRELVEAQSDDRPALQL
jgi:hypothetical protein